jgi:glycosyltransferase involved in cell wall biosynthesis
MPRLTQKVKVLANINNQEYINKMANAFYPDEYESSTFKILTVARINHQKDIEGLLEAAYGLKERGARFRWFVLGRDTGDEYSKSCHELKKNLGLNGDVIFLGERPNPFPYYKHCDLYAQTSFFEGRPLAVEEAMALKCPIVTTDYPPTYDQIKDGVNGRICPHDPSAIADVIYGLYCDRKELKRLGEANSGYRGDSDKEKYFEYFS